MFYSQHKVGWWRKKVFDMNLLFETLSGSHLYGTNHEGSDLDYRGVFAPSVRDSLNPFSQKDVVESKDEEDTVYYSASKFFVLAYAMNPNVVELLFATEKTLRQVSNKGRYLLENRELFLSQKARYTFLGYASQQMHRIKLHRGYLLNPPTHKPAREEFGLDAMPKFSMDKLTSLLHSPAEAVKDEWREYVLKEYKYRQASDEYQKYEQWSRNRNPKRAELERKFGYDLKHANHLVRLLLEGKELLTTGEIGFPLNFASLLKGVLGGVFSYEKLLVMVDDLTSEFNSCPSVLPVEADKEKLLSLYWDLLGV